MVVIAGNIAGIAVEGFSRGVRKLIPDRGASPSLPGCAFNLIGSGGNTELKGNRDALNSQRRQVIVACQVGRAVVEVLQDIRGAS